MGWGTRLEEVLPQLWQLVPGQGVGSGSGQLELAVVSPWDCSVS